MGAPSFLVILFMSFSAMMKRGRFRETTNSLSPGGSFRCFCFKFLALDDNKYQQVLQTIVLATASDFRPGHKSLRTGNSILTDTGWSGWFFGPETAGNWSSPSGSRRWIYPETEIHRKWTPAIPSGFPSINGPQDGGLFGGVMQISRHPTK